MKLRTALNGRGGERVKPADSGYHRVSLDAKKGDRA